MRNWLKNRAKRHEPGAMGLNQPELGLYVHLPFCPSRCPYCDFFASPFEPDKAKALLGALPGHLDCLAKMAGGRPLDTLYLGGGTPAMLPAAWLGGLLEAVRKRMVINPGAELSIEANPGALGARKLKLLRGLGLNRLSLGAQAMDPKGLKALGRRHSVQDVARTVKQARRAGFDNLSLDLIYGAPGHDNARTLESLGRALDLEPDHLSLYELTLSPHTPFGEKYQKGVAPLPDDDQLAEFEEQATGLLAGAGLMRYEVSNYARPGFECRHNQSTWRGGDYLALGPGAHGHLAGRRWAYLAGVKAYVDKLGKGEEPLEFCEELSPLERAQELVILGLRTLEGVDLDSVQGLLGRSLQEFWSGPVARLNELGLARLENRRLVPTSKGLAMADGAAELFM
jgi:oxygen-independent coproporphyrinogen-3 oxidase